ncbi:hypothetical protein OROMI_002403 [Orobanche minor]
MVWFQCEDCGDNLKKPKLANHFRQCSAFKLSCIDCGQVFGQQDVESHTQCITESEKYGPKGQGKATNGTNTKTRNDTKQKPEVDINVGLSERPPWFCSYPRKKGYSILVKNCVSRGVGIRTGCVWDTPCGVSE